MPLDLLRTADLAGLPAAAQDPTAATARLRRRALARARRPVVAAAMALAAPAAWLALSAPPGAAEQEREPSADSARLVVPAGRAVVPVVPAEPAAAAVVRPGDSVDVYALHTWDQASDAVAERVAHRAEVAAASPGSSVADLVDLPGGQAEGVLLLAVTPTEARALAGAAGALVSIAVLPDE